MIQPTRQLVTALGAGFVIALVPVFVPALWVAWVVYVASVLLAGGGDIIAAASVSEVSCEVEAPANIFLGDDAFVTLTLQAPPGSAATVDVVLDVEGDVEPPVIQTATLDTSGHATVRVPVRPTRRGLVSVVRVHMRWMGPLGLFWQVHEVAVDHTIAVVPNLGAVRRAALRLATHHTFMRGLKQRRYIGDGSEFEALREYVPGLDIRNIDWRSTARARTLMCREHRSERNHRVVLAIDTGNLMSEPLEGIPRLDHAINAGLLLGYMTLRTGDQVGLFAFDAEVRAYVEPRSGARTLHRLMEQTMRLQYTGVETNFTLGLSELATRLRRRAVVVVLTDFTDTTSAELMVERLQWLARRHLVLFVAIRDPALAPIVSAPPEDMLAINRAVIADELARDRELVLARLRRAGVFCIDGAPSEISVGLINQYLEIHRRELV